MCKVCQQYDYLSNKPGRMTASVSRYGYIEIRHITQDNGKMTLWQDWIDINYCPVCGRKLRKD